MCVDGDFNEWIDQGLSDYEIAEGCIEHLNTPPTRKKYAKKAPKAPYGILQLKAQQRKYDEDGKLSYVLVVTTDQKKNRNFWGVGRGK